MAMQTTHRSTNMLRCKTVVVGDAHVGKSAITQMFNSGGQNYPKNYVMTIGVDFCVSQVKIPDTDTTVELYLFDAAGQSIFNQLSQGNKYWEGASMVVVVYDVSSRESFQSCGKWLQGVRATRPVKPIGGVLLANKIDLQDTGRRVVDAQEGMAFAQQNGLTYFECSALQGTEVDAPFNFIANAFHNSYEDMLDGFSFNEDVMNNSR
jgi:transport family protein 27